MEVSPPLSSTPAAGKKPQKAFSCVRCFDRKVKCTKQVPCTSCTRAGVECVFRRPSPPRRQKKRTQAELLLARLKRCEDILQSHGLSPDQSQRHEPGEVHEPDQEQHKESLGQGALSRHDSAISNENNGTPNAPQNAEIKDLGNLVVEQGRTRFFENNLFGNLKEELHANDDTLLDPSSGDESEASGDFASAPHSLDFLLGMSPTSAPLTSLHPPPPLIYKLWQVFLDNINPLTKIIHRPTLQSAIFDASFNLDKVPKGLEALMFAIYASATFSISDTECTEMLHEEKTTLLARYRLGLRKALVRANFLATSELQVLQAFIIYLLSMRLLYDARTMWILAGVASRLAQSLGLHRDGSTLGLSPFDTEMRRRLWWQVVTLDSISAEVSGLSRSPYSAGWDTKVTAHVDDADLWPQMTQEPVPVTGRATEMISCSLRCELGDFVSKSQPLAAHANSGDWQSLWTSPNVPTADKDKMIEEIENRFEDKYVRYCDPTIAVQFHTIIVARSVICGMRLMAHHPRHRTDKEREQSKEELGMVFTLALQMLENDNVCHSSRVFRPFLWHTHNYFPWQGFIYLAGALRSRTEGPEVIRAWQQIEEMYQHRPAFLTDTKRPLHVATGSLCLKAWQAREAVLATQGMASLPSMTPAFIQTLRQQRSKHTPPTAHPLGAGSRTDMFPSHYQNPNPGGLFSAPTNTNMEFGVNGDFDTMMLADFSMEDVSPMDWDEWDNLVKGYGTSQLQDWTDVPGLSS